MDLTSVPLLVVGAGLMGTGIAQVAAQAGHTVWLYDTREGAAADAKVKLAATLDGLVGKGKLEAAVAQGALNRILPVAKLAEAREARLVVEAIVEQLDVKRALFRELEALVAEDCVLATNTSSISVTAIANGLAHPGRMVGMHFFNPVPLMKLVEVVSGLQTSPAVAQAIFDLSKAWRKTPVHAKSTPGFIVNRIARPYYAETLALLHEQAATPVVLDACLKGAGFRMGPCELMDLIGHDTNFAVTRSVYDANFQDKRYMPSLVQRELVDGGLLGRKSGRGFYDYAQPMPGLPVAVHGAPDSAREVAVHGSGPIAEALFAAATKVLADQGWGPARETTSDWTGLAIDGACLVMTDGRTAQDWAAAQGVTDVVVFDRPQRVATAAATTATPTSDPAEALQGLPLAWAASAGCGERWRRQAPAWLAALGVMPLPLTDAPGLVVARTLAMLINEGADAVQQGVCDEAGADAAMRLGVAYPAGPFEWLGQWSVPGVVTLLEELDLHYRGERYRVSPWLRRRAG